MYLVASCFLASPLLFPLLLFLLSLSFLLLLLLSLSLSVSLSLSPHQCDISSPKTSPCGLALPQHGGLRVGTLHTRGLAPNRQEVKAARPGKACASNDLTATSTEFDWWPTHISGLKTQSPPLHGRWPRSHCRRVCGIPFSFLETIICHGKKQKPTALLKKVLL